MRRLVLVIAVIALAAARQAAACSGPPRTPFELFDSAATVAIVEVRAVPRRLVGDRVAAAATFAVRASLKGEPRGELTVAQGNTSCSPQFHRGATALVFVDADGAIVGGDDGYREAVLTWPALLRRWATATNARARDRLVATAPHAQLDSLLPAVLARLRDPRAASVLARREFAVLAEVTAALIATTRFEAVAEPAALADAIAATAVTDGDRIAALERCERVHGHPLFPFTSYASGFAGGLWPQLATACRTGAPLR